MAYDLQWLWSVIKALVPSIADLFESLWSAIEPITNLGQGFAAGFAVFASALWDAIKKFADTFGNWISDAFSWIYVGITTLAKDFGQWFATAFSYVQNGFQWIASQIYSFGQWIYNSVYGLWEWWMNILYGLYTALAGFFSGIATAVGNWWSNVASGINSYFTSLFTGIRSKIVNTIIADVSLYYGWKCVERITQLNSAKDLLYGLSGMLIAPFAGAIFGSIVDGLLPTPSTEPIPIVPQISPFSFTPPSLSITPPTRPSLPTAPTTPEVPPSPYVGAVSKQLGIPSITYNVTTTSQDKALSIPSLSYDYLWLHQPVSDLVVGNWTSTPLYQKLQKGTDNTVTYIASKSLDTGQSDTFQVGLSALPTPPSRTGHKVHVYARKSSSGGRYVDLYVYLYQGSTLIAQASWLNISENWGDYVLELSESQADAITDYSNLSVMVTASVAGGASGTRQCYVARVYMERPIST